jgi:hypothetical protein
MFVWILVLGNLLICQLLLVWHLLRVVFMVGMMNNSAMAALATMGIVEFETYVRPRMIPIHEMKDPQGFRDEKGSVDLPPEVPLSAEQLRTDSVFLIDNGFNFFIRIGRGASSTFLTDAFGVASFDELDSRVIHPISSCFIAFFCLVSSSMYVTRTERPFASCSS